MNYLSTVMESTYSTAKICDVFEDPETCVPSLELEPGKHNPLFTTLRALLNDFFWGFLFRLQFLFTTYNIFLDYKTKIVSNLLI